MKQVSLPSTFAKRALTLWRLRRIAVLGIVPSLGLASAPSLFSQSAPVEAMQTSPLVRHYRAGEAIAYTMQAINQGHTSTIRYEARADGPVQRNASGNFIEDLAWTNLSFNGAAVPLSTVSQEFREPLSLAPQVKLSIPDLSKVQPGLIGPILDLLTFYADVQLAMRQQGLVHAGDHVYVQHGKPNSWAGGKITLFGQDAVDFDITLSAVDPTLHVLTLVVRHVPPAQSRIGFPATWMSTPIEGPINNWAQVQKEDNGKYLAQVGRETFDDTIKLSLPSGQILSAVMQNPVDVSERECDDASLSACGVPSRYRINRQIVVEAVEP
jgi:hypothetical protein